jgi:methylglutaconyl-CoA hydratase
MDYRTLEVDVAQGVGTIWLNRPDVRNAMNEDLIGELAFAVRALGADAQVRVVVLAGRGTAFCAGADLGWMKRMAEYSHAENRGSALELAHMLNALRTCPKPTIARVHGPAFAGGMGLASACDIRVAEPAAEFCLSEVRIGLVPATISPYVVQAMGAAAARRYMLTAERLPATEAHRIGFVHALSAPGAIDETVGQLARALLGASPAALARTKRLLEDVVDRPVDDALLAMTAEAIADVRASAEGREGVGSFLEKRKPAWVRS